MIARDLINYSFAFASLLTVYSKELVGFFFFFFPPSWLIILSFSSGFFCVLSYLACVGRGQHFNSDSRFYSCTTETSGFSYFLSVSLLAVLECVNMKGKVECVQFV